MRKKSILMTAVMMAAASMITSCNTDGRTWSVLWPKTVIRG